MKTHTELRRLIDQKDKQIAKAKKIVILYVFHLGVLGENSAKYI